MTTTNSPQLLALIEEALGLADSLGAHETGIWLDRARVAAGGAPEISPVRMQQYGFVPSVTIRVEAATIGECATATG